MRKAMIALKDRHEPLGLTSAAAAMAAPGAELEVVHIVELGDAEGFAEADIVVNAAVELLRAHGLAAYGTVVPLAEGGLAQRLADRARRCGVELLVMGSRGLGSMDGLLARSVGHAVLAKVDVPALVVPASAGLPLHGFRRVLVALRGEEEAAPAAAALGLLPGPVEILVVHVPRILGVQVGTTWADTVVELPETATHVLAEAGRRLRQAGMPVATMTLPRDGGVGQTIVQAGRRWEADLLVVGSRRLTDWETLLAGSTSSDVLRYSDRPVLIAGRPQIPA